MEAKTWQDTVMNDDRMDQVTWNLREVPHCTKDTIRIIAATQAEISYKAGIKEVVEWIEKHSQMAKYDLTRIDPDWFKWIDDNEWQAKLKEWGIE